MSGKITVKDIVEIYEKTFADAEYYVLRSKWVPIYKGEAGYSAGDFRCALCGKPNKCYSLTPYCPNCGASMTNGTDYAGGISYTDHTDEVHNNAD